MKYIQKLAISLIALFVAMPLVMVSAQQEDQSDRSILIQNIRQNHIRARESFTARKEAYGRTAEKIKSTRENFLEIKERFIDSKDPIVRAEYLKRAQEHLSQLLDSMTSHTLHLKSKVEGSITLQSEDKALLIATIDDQLKTLNEYKSEVSAITNPDSLKDMAQRLRSQWKEIRGTLRFIGSQFIVNRLQGLLASLNASVPRVQDKIVELQDTGLGTASIEKPLQLLQTSITNAQTALEASQRLLNGFRSGENDVQFSEVMKMIRQAHTQLIGGGKALKQIIRNIKILLGEPLQNDAQPDLSTKSTSTTQGTDTPPSGLNTVGPTLNLN